MKIKHFLLNQNINVANLTENYEKMNLKIDTTLPNISDCGCEKLR